MISGEEHYRASDPKGTADPLVDSGEHEAVLPVTPEVQALRKQNSDLQKALHKAHQEISTQKGEFADFSRRFEEERKELFTEITTLRRRVREVEVQLVLSKESSSAAERAKNRTEEDAHSETKEKLQNLCEEVWSTAQKLGLGLKKHSSKKLSPDQLFTFLRESLTSFEQEIVGGREKKRVQRQEAERKTQELQHSNTTLAGNVEGLTHQLKEVRERFSELEKSLLNFRRVQEELAALKSENEVLRREVEAKEQALQKLREDLQGARAEAQELTESLTKKRSKRDELLELLLHQQSKREPPPSEALRKAFQGPAQAIAKYLQDNTGSEKGVTALLEIGKRAEIIREALGTLKQAQGEIAAKGEAALESAEFLELDQAEQNLYTFVAQVVNRTGALDIIFELTPEEADPFILNLAPPIQEQVLLGLLYDPTRVHGIYSDFFFARVDQLDSRVRAALADSCGSPEHILRVLFGGAALRSAVNALTGLLTPEGGVRADVDPAHAVAAYHAYMQPGSGAPAAEIAKFTRAIETMDFVHFVSRESLAEVHAAFLESPDKLANAKRILLGINPLIALAFVDPNPYQE